MKKIIKIILGLICILVLVFVGLIGYATLSDYQPDPTAVVFEKQDAKAISTQKNYKLLIWNIGYGGLGRDMDFFYDGGK
ncbi:MAG: endonuclease, partial [Desulfobacula sp.]|nr:endonuclease [Desulfobacula sp.]